MQHRQEDTEQDGFGIVEVLVAMALLMVISLAMLPIFISSLKQAGTNISLTTATQVVSQEMDKARMNLAPTCAAVQGHASEVVGLFQEDPRGIVLDIHRDASDTCPTYYPAPYRYKVWVTLHNSSVVIAQAETYIRITSSGYP